MGGDTLVCGAIYNNPDPALQAKVTMTDMISTLSFLAMFST